MRYQSIALIFIILPAATAKEPTNIVPVLHYFARLKRCFWTMFC